MYIIQDWAGNVLENGQTFESFEDGWEHILGDMTDRLKLEEDDYQEYFVLPKNTRETKYLDPNDPRQGRVNGGNK